MLTVLWNCVVGAFLVLLALILTFIALLGVYSVSVLAKTMAEKWSGRKGETNDKR